MPRSLLREGVLILRLGPLIQPQGLGAVEGMASGIVKPPGIDIRPHPESTVGRTAKEP